MAPTSACSAFWPTAIQARQWANSRRIRTLDARSRAWPDSVVLWHSGHVVDGARSVMTWHGHARIAGRVVTLYRGLLLLKCVRVLLYAGGLVAAVISSA